MNSQDDMDTNLINSIDGIFYIGSYLHDYPRHRIIQAGLHDLGLPVREIVDRGILPIRWWRLGRAVSRVPRFSPIVIGEASNYLFPDLILARMMRRYLVFDVFVPTYDYAEENEGRWSTKLLAPIFKSIDIINNRSASSVVLDTQQTRKYFVEELGLRPEKAFVAYVGAETDLFYPVYKDVNHTRPFRILFYGSYLSLHGIDIIVHAAKLVQNVRSDVKFQLVGTGPARHSNEDLARRLGLKNIEFGPDFVPYHQLPEIIEASDICLGIFANRSKTHRVIPNKLYQCAAMGKPVITADTPAVKEGFTEDEIALVEPGNPEALAEAILALIDDEVLRKRLGMSGMKAIHDRYNPRIIASQFIKAFQAI